jgi:hypothetical protein
MKLSIAIAAAVSAVALTACQTGAQYDGVSRFAGSSAFDAGNHHIPEKDKPVPVPGPVPSPDLGASPGKA